MSGEGPTLKQLLESNPAAKAMLDRYKWPDENATRTDVARFVLAAGAKDERADMKARAPTLSHQARYCTPQAMEAREFAINLGRVAGVVGVCIDDECDLSGGYAHAGPCEACDCPLRHARAECPQSTPAAVLDALRVPPEFLGEQGSHELAVVAFDLHAPPTTFPPLTLSRAPTEGDEAFLEWAKSAGLVPGDL